LLVLFWLGVGVWPNTNTTQPQPNQPPHPPPTQPPPKPPTKTPPTPNRPSGKMRVVRQPAMEKSHTEKTGEGKGRRPKRTREKNQTETQFRAGESRCGAAIQGARKRTRQVNTSCSHQIKVGDEEEGENPFRGCLSLITFSKEKNGGNPVKIALNLDRRTRETGFSIQELAQRLRRFKYDIKRLSSCTDYEKVHGGSKGACVRKERKKGGEQIGTLGTNGGKKGLWTQ